MLHPVETGRISFSRLIWHWSVKRVSRRAPKLAVSASLKVVLGSQIRINRDKSQILYEVGSEVGVPAVRDYLGHRGGLRSLPLASFASTRKVPDRLARLGRMKLHEDGVGAGDRG